MTDLLDSMFYLLVATKLIYTLALLKFCANIKRKEEHNQISLAKSMTNTKFYTCCFRAAMASPERFRFLDFQINICLVVA